MPQTPPLFILIAVAAVSTLSVNIFLPSMPGLQREFSTSYATVQLTLTLYLAGLAVAQLLYGPLSDRFGRRPMMLIGLAIYLAGSTICMTAPSIGVLIGGRILQAVGGCAGIVLSRAIVRDLHGRDQAASKIAFITMATMAAPMLAPAIGGFLDVWYGWRAGFVFVTGFAAIVAAGIFFLLPETHGPERRATAAFSADAMVRLIGQPAFWGYALQVSFTSAGFFGFLSGAPYVIVMLMGAPPSTFGLYFIAISSFYMAGNFAAARLSVARGTDRMISTGCWIAILGGVAIAAIHAAGLTGPATLFGAMAVIALGSGLAIPNGIAGAISVDARLAGSASGIAGFAQMAFGAGASALVGTLLTTTATPLVAVMLAGALLAYASHLAGRWFGRGRGRGRERERSDKGHFGSMPNDRQ